MVDLKDTWIMDKDVWGVVIAIIACLVMLSLMGFFNNPQYEENKLLCNDFCKSLGYENSTIHKIGYECCCYKWEYTDGFKYFQETEEVCFDNIERVNGE